MLDARPALSILAVLAALSTSALSSFAIEPLGDRPTWIWATPTGELASQNEWQDRAVTFEKTIEVSHSLRDARVVGGADFCHLTIVINGRRAAVVDAYADWFELDVTEFFRQGKNVIQLQAAPVAGPSAVACEFRVSSADGEPRQYLTDQGWTPGEDWQTLEFGKVLPQMWLPARPAKVEPYEDYTQWRRALRDDSGAATNETDAATFDVADGYEIEHVLRAAPDQSSWVSMGVSTTSGGKAGSAGVLIGREDQGFLRVRFSEDSSGSGPVARIAPVPCDQPLLEPRGIAPHGRRSNPGAAQATTWTANANNSKAIYTLTDDGERLTAAKLFDFPGGVGHGRNDLFWTLAPKADWSGNSAALTLQGLDEVLYSIHGDAVDVPRGPEIGDRTSPFRKARQGQQTREGHLLQMRRPMDASKWELTVLAAGLRNPYGVAMNEHGEKFAYDADAEFDMGAPWYRPTRIVHLTAGSDYGWRGVTKQWPPYFPDHADNALPLCDIGKGSPTSVAFGYPAAFPAADRGALYVLDWAYGRVLRVHLTPRGSGYRARCETFLQGRPLNVTDLGFYDGDMLLITGGRKTQSNLYRVRYTGDPNQEQQTQQQRRREAFGRQQRLLRRRIEQLQRPLADSQRAEMIAAEIVPQLNDPDPGMRYAARIALEHQPVEDWKELAFETRDPVIRMTLLTALAATNDPPRQRILTELNTIDWRSLPPAEQLRLLRCDAMCLQGEAVDSLRDLLAERHMAMCQETVTHAAPTGLGKSVSQEALRLLLEAEAPAATAVAVERLQAADNQHDEMFYLFALRHTRAGWTPELRRIYFAAFAHSHDYLGGDGMPGFIRQIHDEAVAATPEADRAALGELLELERDVEFEPPPKRPHVAKWTLAALAAKLETLPAGDARRGQQVFRDALCARCHRMGSEGRPIGPDLTNVGRRFRRADMLRSVVLPSDVVAPKYRQYSIVTEDGKQLTGIGTWGGDYRDPKLRLVTDPLRPDQAVEIPKQEIARRQLSELSPMPQGLLDHFTPSEVQDLLAFLRIGD